MLPRYDYTTGCLLNDTYFKDYQKMIEVDLSKQQASDADYKAIQQINFKANLDRAVIYFIFWKTKETVIDLSKRTVKVL